MLRSIKQLSGIKLGALDGHIGHVKDFYFDDQNWAIRYLVADTGNWLPGRQVLISPYSLGQLDGAEEILHVNLSREQIENSPPIGSHMPVSRQYEQEYYRYHGWPYYWEGSGLWGLSGFPILELPVKHGQAGLIEPQGDRNDAHLRSALAVTGYHLRTSSGIIGHVSDFMVEPGSWAIGQLVVKSSRFLGKEMLIPTKDVDQISYDVSTVFATLTGKAATELPEMANDKQPALI